MRELQHLIEELSCIRSVKLVVLYGSWARREASKKSDIDLFILAAERDRERVEDVISKGDFRVQPVIRSPGKLSTTDSGLLENILRDGKILYAKNTELDASRILKQKPAVVYSFRLGNLSQQRKRKFNSALYGTKIKNYKYRGMIEQLGGIQLGRGCILVPENKKKGVESLFESYKIKHEKMKIWL
ncbi:MAG: nucleotidyltransferase domain-containing protein [Candidatus Micrarchaeota archaeon]|nr:nucleotidyltransferase domain-containing protein [Candidatus Micrarchaeota archaeon]